ncbi:DIS3-like exonuclease 2, partial [Artemia franciscana]|uniref:DIS3-like exonuclease 2 n=1 Tax=Artemia franciscana TaxID=6661 RepID=UPI0032DA0CF3
ICSFLLGRILTVYILIHFRNQCVFTIDPSTARDLDDAVSCIPLGDDRYRIGVHIADVSFFVKENTPLDSAASHRGTSVYLVQKVVPMLPRLLCEQLCSLNPGEDRLAFSVEWVVNGEGDIEEEWFGRSVIKSCAKLAYEHAQSIIENPGKNDWAQNELPEIQKPFTIHDVCGVVTNLQKIACSLRQRRHAYGALRLDLPRIGWTLDRETGMPTGFRIYQLKDSNRLIEELMLLANMAVARKIYTTFPDVTLLRCHPPPQELMLQEVAQCLASIGIHVDTSSSGSLQNSLHRYYGVRSELPKLNPDDEDWAAVGRAIVMTNLIAKPMVVAKYISAGVKKEPSEFRHYALAVPLYTHFTSPIRRYPDLIVHRLLASSLGYCEKPRWDAKSLHKVAERCNDRKATAKMVGDLSSEMFLGLFIKTVGSIATRGVVLQVLDRSVDVVLLNSGLIKRVYMDKLPLKKLTHESQCGIGTLTLVWDNGPNLTDLVQVLTIFSMVEVRLEEGESALKFSAILVKPETLE